MFKKAIEEMVKESYLFWGIPIFWWFSLVVFSLLIMAFVHRHRKRK